MNSKNIFWVAVATIIGLVVWDKRDEIDWGTVVKWGVAICLVLFVCFTALLIAIN